MLPRLLCLLALGAIVATALACARAPFPPFSQIRAAITGSPPELGTVAWLRNYDDAVARATREERPILLLFQEVPGCQTCVDFGRDALSHPLVVDAIEERVRAARDSQQRAGSRRHHSPPLRGAELELPRRALHRYATGADIIARRDGIWSREGLIRRMIVALQTAGQRRCPTRLRIAHAEARTSSRGRSRRLRCTATGRAKAHLGALDGVDHHHRPAGRTAWRPSTCASIPT